MTRPIVLLHGWGLSSRVWAPLQHAFAGGLHVHAPDLPGHGNAAPAEAGLDAWRRALLPELPEACVLVGWSLGALLALDLAHRHPERVARLVLIGASPCFVQTDTWQPAMPAATLADFRHQFDTAPDATLGRFIALQGVGDARRREVVRCLDAALTPADTAHKTALAEGLGLLADLDLCTIVPTLSQPVRLLHGAGDSLMPVAAAEWLADTLPDGRLSVFMDAGHAPFLSRPVECASLIEGFAHD